MHLAQIDDLVAVAALALGLVHGRICVTNELSRRVDGTTGESHTYAGGDFDFDGRKDIRRGESRADAGSDRRQARFSAKVFTQDDELVTGQPRQAVGRPQ